MSKHTPGPWIVYRETSCDRGTSYGIKAPHPHYWVIPPLNIKEEDANVLAASLELLESLEQTQILLEWLGFQSSDEYQANAAAIAKAKGEK